MLSSLAENGPINYLRFQKFTNFFMTSFWAGFLSTLACPIAVPWAWFQERNILQHGRPLREEELVFGRTLEILDVEKVRILIVPRIPMPVPRWIEDRFHRWLPAFPMPAGMTLGHGIFVVKAYAEDVSMLRHELVHVRQHEVCGGHGIFLWRYLQQCLSVGYEHAPMEIEARERSGC